MRGGGEEEKARGDTADGESHQMIAVSVFCSPGPGPDLRTGTANPSILMTY